jgi:hypothetical protein
VRSLIFDQSSSSAMRSSRNGAGATKSSCKADSPCARLFSCGHAHSHQMGAGGLRETARLLSP